MKVLVKILLGLTITAWVAVAGVFTTIVISPVTAVTILEVYNTVGEIFQSPIDELPSSSLIEESSEEVTNSLPETTDETSEEPVDNEESSEEVVEEETSEEPVDNEESSEEVVEEETSEEPVDNEESSEEVVEEETSEEPVDNEESDLPGSEPAGRILFSNPGSEEEEVVCLALECEDEVVLEYTQEEINLAVKEVERILIEAIIFLLPVTFVLFALNNSLNVSEEVILERLEAKKAKKEQKEKLKIERINKKLAKLGKAPVVAKAAAAPKAVSPKPIAKAKGIGLTGLKIK
jgi:hypothetical protein